MRSPLFLKKHLPFIVLFIIVFVSRLPFLSAGYGIEEDSWGIALAAFHTKLTGIYEPSRLPGHPVQELILSALWGCGPIVFNLLSALFSAIGTIFFALVLKQLNFKHFFIAALAFAFVPVYYISSTYTIDFAWTEAFVLMSLYFLLKSDSNSQYKIVQPPSPSSRRGQGEVLSFRLFYIGFRDNLILCGVFLGLAIGCRITSGAMLLPFMIIIWQHNNLKGNFINLLKISIPLILVVILAFIPIIQQFGLSFFMYYDQFPYPPISKVFYKMIPGVFGVVGIMAIGIGLLTIVLKRNKNSSGELFTNGLDKKIIVASSVIIVLHCISYFRLPQKSGYMTPVIPFVILLFGYYLNSKIFKLVCLAFILSSFVCSINLTDKLRGAAYSKYAITFTVSGQELFFDPFSGPLFSDYSKRKQKMKYVAEIIEKSKNINSKTVIIAGWWYNEIMVEMINRQTNENVIYEGYIDKNKINKYLAEDYKIYYLPEQNIYNDQMYKMKYTNETTSPLNLLSTGEEVEHNR